jgi:hypothetical protein
MAQKTGSDKIFLKNSIPEVENVASGREFLAV